MLKIIKIMAVLVSAAVTAVSVSGSSLALEYEELNGRLLYHSYSAYDAMDSNIYCFDTSSKETAEISSPDFIHAMNADFGSHMYDITFMAIDPLADEWDIYRYNSLTGDFTNLTENSGYRNEDPKFSPDGNKIVFKRGYWSNEYDNFIYNLAEINLSTMGITYLTDDISEDSMPYYSPDGNTICHAMSDNGKTVICSLDKSTLKTEIIYSEENIHAYYPVISESGLYFAKWISADNHNDCIVRYENGNITYLPFNNNEYNCSDPFPLDDGCLFYSGTQNGSYDIFYFNGSESVPINEAASGLHELGASFFSQKNAEDITRKTADFLLGRKQVSHNMDADADGEVSVYDMIAMRKQLE